MVELGPEETLLPFTIRTADAPVWNRRKFFPNFYIRPPPPPTPHSRAAVVLGGQYSPGKLRIERERGHSPTEGRQLRRLV